MLTKQSLLQGLQAYTNHDYLTALKHFSSPSSTSSQLQTLVSLSLTAITNLQLCNYNEAALILGQIRDTLRLHERERGKLGGQMEVLKVKVLANFLILELLNCNGERMEEVLAELLECLAESQEKQEERGKAMFRVVMKSLFGYQSFRMIEQQCQEVSKKITKNQPNINGKGPSKQTNNSKINLSPVLLSAFSLYHHLSGNLNQAILFQQTALSISKDKETIPALLSLRHLQELSKQANDSKAMRQYRNQLLLLMSQQELQGVAQQTLFRNYSKKIDLGTKVVGMLIAHEQQYLTYSSKTTIDKHAIVWKLKKVRKIDSNSQISTVLDLIESNQDVLKIMSQNQFAREARKEYTQCLQIMKKSVNIILKRQWFGIMVENIKLSESRWRQRERQEQRSMQEVQSEQSGRAINHLSHFTVTDQTYTLQKQPQHEQFQPFQQPEIVIHPSPPSQNNNSPYVPQSRSHKKRQPYATSFHLPKHSKHHEISLNASRQRQQSFSRDKVHTNITTKNMKNRVYTNGGSALGTVQGSRVKEIQMKQSKAQESQVNQSRANNVYKIAKQQPANHNKKVESSRVRVEYNHHISNKSYMIARTQEPLLDQFLRQEPTQDKERERSPSPEAKKEPVKIQKEDEGAQKGHNLTKITEEPLQNRQTKANHDLSKTDIVKSEVTRFKPTQTSSIPALKPQNSSVTEIAVHLKSKKAETVYQINLSKQKINEKLRRMISLCQSGQYLQKRHFSSDGGAQRFMMLNKSRDRLYWGDSESDIDISGDKCSYKMEDIRGIVYGKVTETMRKQCNHKLESWKCFSLILKKRTFDIYLPQERDLFFWLPGLSLCLRDVNYSSPLYEIAQNYHHKVEKAKPANIISFGNKDADRFYSMGRVLWRRFLMKLKHEYVHVKKHEKVRKFSNENAYAIVTAAVYKMGYKPTVMKKTVTI